MTDFDAVTNEVMWDAAANWGMSDRMNEIETVMWRAERHPQWSSTISAIGIFDTAPDWDRLVAAHDWAIHMVPRFRHRVVEPALPVGPTAWEVDPNFDLGYHLRRVTLPAPGGMRQLLDLAQSLAMNPFDRRRPLWESVLVEGLEGGKAAYVLKLHHAWTDGLGGIQLLSMLQSRTRDHTPNKPMPALPEAVPTDRMALAASEVLDQVRAAPGLLKGAAGMLLRRPDDLAGDAVKLAGSVQRTFAKPPAKPSPLLAGGTGRVWRFHTLECPLSELKKAGKSAGGSVTDAFIASLLGGLRIYHEKHDVAIDELPMMMPVSMRKSDDPSGGNKFAGSMLAGPIGLADPAERIAAIHGLVLSVRSEPALMLLGGIAPVFNRIPPAAAHFALSRVGAAADMSASSVPGIPFETYVAGAKVERMIPFGPLPSVAVMATMVSHCGTCCFGLNIDGTAVKDDDVLADCFQQGLDEVLELAR